MKKITLFSILAAFVAALSFTSCNTDSDNSYQLPSKQEAYQMMVNIAGYGPRQCGILFPADEKNNIKEKDSIITNITINPTDSSYVISNFPVKLLAKYVKDEKCKKLISELPNQNVRGKLYPYDATSSLFFTATNNISFKDENSNNYALKFYALNNLAIAGISMDKKNFLLYLTPGGIYDGTEEISNALKTATGTYGNITYHITLSYKL